MNIVETVLRIFFEFLHLKTFYFTSVIFGPPSSDYSYIQAGAELCQSQVELEVVVKVGVELEACHY